LIRTGQAIEDRLRQPHDLAADVYVQADDVWPSFMATGVKVAVIDTGVQANHVELADSIIATANFTTESNDDVEAHGTHVSGIITGNGVHELINFFGYPSPNRGTGVAPGGGILSAKVCGSAGCHDSDIVQGLTWALDNGADVINLSLGGGNFGGHCDGDFLAGEINDAVDAGAIVVVSSGNDAAGVSSPACASKAIAVGAVYHANIGNRSYTPCSDQGSAPDQIVCFSNTGTALDVVAPGAAVLSSYSCHVPGLNCAETYYGWFYGTSMAAPHVSAAAALILDKNPNLTPAQVKSILEGSARDLGASGRDDTFGWGVLDVAAAIADTPAIVDINVTSDKSIAFGLQPLSFTVNTTSAGINDVQKVQVMAGPADILIKTTLFTDGVGEGSNAWTLGTANGPDQVVWEFSTDGQIYTKFTAAGVLMEIHENVAQGTIIDLYFRLTMPASTSSTNQHGATVTLVAVEPG